MIPREAIEKAIEGGWMPKYATKLDYVGDKAAYFFYKYDQEQQIPSSGIWLTEIALDPSFWQALGLWYSKHGKPRNKKITNEQVWKSWGINQGRKHNDLILTKGDTEKFWQELLSA